MFIWVNNRGCGACQDNNERPQVARPPSSNKSAVTVELDNRNDIKAQSYTAPQTLERTIVGKEQTLK